MRISATEFIDRFAELAEKVPSEPITVTRNGNDHLVVLSAGEYARLKRRDREVILPTDLTPEEIEALESAEVPASLADLDAELKEPVR